VALQTHGLKAEHRQAAIECGDADRWHPEKNPLGQMYTTRSDGKQVPWNGVYQFFDGCRDFAFTEHGHLEFFNRHSMKVILMAHNPSVKEQLVELFTWDCKRTKDLVLSGEEKMHDPRTATFS
jgi:hypothetical protein